MPQPHRLRARVKANQPKTPPIRQVADRLEPRLRRAVLLAIDRVRNAADLELLEAAVRNNNLSQIRSVLDRYGIAMDQVQRVMGTAFAQTGALSADVLSSQLGVDVSFNVVNPRAVNWMRREGGRLISNMTEEGFQAVRTILNESFATGMSPARTARQLRDVLGLTDRLTEAVVRNARRLREAGRTEAQIDRASTRYTNQLTRYRADVVARSEIIAASAAGQNESWHQARDRGLLGANAKRVWIVTPDDRTCEDICVPMEDQEVGLNEPFTTGDGSTVMTPPAHPQCRCAMGINP